MSLHQSSQELLATHSEEYTSISIYSGELRQETVAKQVAKVKAAFPSLMPEFYSLLIARFKEKGFDDSRVIDAVNNVIDTCQYPTPTLANFLSFDKRVKVYNYNDMCNYIMSSGGVVKMADFSKVSINKKQFWVKCTEKELYNIPNEL